jgi:8-amino-7-oxononanoate synthase
LFSIHLLFFFVIMEHRMMKQLMKRRQNGNLRTQVPMKELCQDSGVDFSPNDYLGLAKSSQQKKLVDKLYHEQGDIRLGATGSRLLSGDSSYVRNLENWLATLHRRPTVTLFNSGYDANLSILSSLILPTDLVVIDELCHNSLVMGIQMSRQREYRTFAHNSVTSLQQVLKEYRSSYSLCLIVVESVYSMDGDIAPLVEILDTAQQFNAQVIVDDAHGLGIYGRTNQNDLQISNDVLNNEFMSSYVGGTGVIAALELEQHPSLLCSVHTFGKAAGCHGAIICGSEILRDYLWNYARPFIYSTSLPLHSLVAIRCAYMTITGPDGHSRRAQIFRLVRLFRAILMKEVNRFASGLEKSLVSLWPSPSPIQALLLAGGNESCQEFCRLMWEDWSFKLYPIRAPTVPRGQERVRIILHAHNNEDEVRTLCSAIVQCCQRMGLLSTSRL